MREALLCAGNVLYSIVSKEAVLTSMAGKNRAR